MDFLVTMDNLLCRFLGMSTPWSTSRPTNITCYATGKFNAYILYALPYLMFYFATFFSHKGPWNFIMDVLIASNAVCVVIEVYVNAYMYNATNKKFNKFCQDFLENGESHSSNALDDFNSSGSSSNNNRCNRELSLFLINMADLACQAFDTYSTPDFVSIAGTLRVLVVMPITLQWSLCMLHVDGQIAKVMRLMKTALQPDTALAGVKRLKLDGVDGAAEVYRKVADRHASVNQQYGIHLALNTCVTLCYLVSAAYGSWSMFVYSTVPTPLHYYFLVRAILHLIYIVIVALIGDSANQQVSN